VCADCVAGEIVTVAGNQVARIVYELDDRAAADSTLIRRLEAVARSFRWRPRQG
jgi:hypothetical protein